MPVFVELLISPEKEENLPCQNDIREISSQKVEWLFQGEGNRTKESASVSEQEEGRTVVFKLKIIINR